jgi:hypothetical protein
MTARQLMQIDSLTPNNDDVHKDYCGLSPVSCDARYNTADTPNGCCSNNCCYGNEWCCSRYQECIACADNQKVKWIIIGVVVGVIVLLVCVGVCVYCHRRSPKRTAPADFLPMPAPINTNSNEAVQMRVLQMYPPPARSHQTQQEHQTQPPIGVHSNKGVVL